MAELGLHATVMVTEVVQQRRRLALAASRRRPGLGRPRVQPRCSSKKLRVRRQASLDEAWWNDARSGQWKPWSASA